MLVFEIPLFFRKLNSFLNATIYAVLMHVGGMAYWLERRSLAGGLSLIYAWSMVDIWPPRG